jgi:glycosyltransferase domain-containing protein
MSKCTIIIPTFNRSRYLKRILSYYDKYGRDFNIIVADSSSNENKMINKKIISSLSNIDIQYLEKYSERINLPSKLYNSLSYIKTKYSVFCADDDFITPNGINQSIDFLESNKDFTCAHGYYISFCLEADKKEEQQFYWKPIYPYNSIIFTDAKARLLFLFSSYYQTFYAVHRTDFLKMVFKENYEFADDDRFGELLPSMLDLIYGKMKKLDVLYNMREKIIDSLGATIKNFKDFMKDGTYEKKYNKFRRRYVCIFKKTLF